MVKKSFVKYVIVLTVLSQCKTEQPAWTRTAKSRTNNPMTPKIMFYQLSNCVPQTTLVCLYEAYFA